jgi:hypothetical protein
LTSKNRVFIFFVHSSPTTEADAQPLNQGNNPDKLHEDFSEEDQTGTAGHVPALRAAFFLAANCSRARELSLGVNQESRWVVAQKQ